LDLEHGSEAALHFFWGNLFDTVAENPFMTEGIADRTGSFAVELVRGWSYQRGPGSDRFIGQRVGIIDVQVNHAAGSSRSFWAQNTVFRVFIGQHQDDVAQDKLAMSDPTARLGQSETLAGSKDLCIERDGCLRAANTEIGKGFVYGVPLLMHLYSKF